MALGKFFLEDRQFGTEVIFTYGPLGFIMGNTYWGGQWISLAIWQGIVALIVSTILYPNAFRLTGYNRLFYLAFFILVGLSYQDATHLIELLRTGEIHQPYSVCDVGGVVLRPWLLLFPEGSRCYKGRHSFSGHIRIGLGVMRPTPQ
jgi:hypothetical protein